MLLVKDGLMSSLITTVKYSGGGGHFNMEARYTCVPQVIGKMKNIFP